MVDHRYVFDGFRLSYLFGVVPRGAWRVEAGASLQIRSAQVAFSSVDGAQHAAEANIGPVGALKLRLTHQPGKLMVNCLIQPGLIAEARAVLDLAAELGIWFCPVPRNIGPRIDPALLADPEYPKLVAELLARQRAGARITGSLRMNQRLLTAAPFDCRNTLKPHVDHDGRLAWPCKASVHVEPEWIDVLAHDHVDAIWAEGTRRRDPTGFQGQGPAQCGGDCNWAQNYTTDEYAHGLDHPLHLLGTMRGFLGGRR